MWIEEIRQGKNKSRIESRIESKMDSTRQRTRRGRRRGVRGEERLMVMKYTCKERDTYTYEFKIHLGKLELFSFYFSDMEKTRND